MASTSTHLIPIRYRDPATAVDWLCRALGFGRHFVAEENGAIVHAQLRVGDALLFLGPDHIDDKYGMHSPLSLSGTNQCVYIATAEDIDSHCARARKAGAEIVTEPYDTPYGGREYSCRDIEGHVWSGELPRRAGVDRRDWYHRNTTTGARQLRSLCVCECNSSC